MKCPYCAHLETKVVDSRAAEGGSAIRRRRECLNCKQRFTTFEKMEEIPITVVKKNQEREPLDRGKILAGLIRATVKRPIAREELEKVVDDIETDLRNQFKYEVSSREIGEMALKRLRKMDKVAYVRFASVYRDFKDIEEFTKELAKLHKTFAPKRSKTGGRSR